MWMFLEAIMNYTNSLMNIFKLYTLLKEEF